MLDQRYVYKISQCKKSCTDMVHVKLKSNPCQVFLFEMSNDDKFICYLIGDSVGYRKSGGWPKSGEAFVNATGTLIFGTKS